MMMHKVLKTGLALLVCNCSFAMGAEAPSKELSGQAEVTSLITNGNTKGQTSGVSLTLGYSPAPWELTGKSKYLTTISQDVQTAESFEASLRAGREVSDSGSLFVEQAYLKNRFAGFENRRTSALGYSQNLIKTDEQKLKAELSLGYTHEERTDLTMKGFMSGGLGVNYLLKLTTTSELAHETKWTPNFQTNDDWRLTSETSLSASISTFLSSKVAWKYEHVNLPPAGKVKGDTTTTVSLLAKF